MTSPTVFCLSVQLRPNNSGSQQSSKKHESAQTQRTQTSGTTLRAITHPQTESTSGLQTLATEQNGNHIIFLRAIRSDNGKLILTRDDNIRIQDGVLTAVAANLNNKNDTTPGGVGVGAGAGGTSGTTEKNDNEHKRNDTILLNQSQTQNLNLSDVIIPTGSNANSGSGRRNANPVLFYTSAGTAVTGTVSGTSDLTNGNVAFISNDELQVGEFSETGNEKQEVEAKVVSTPLGSDGEPIKLPENLESLPKADHFPIQRHRWNTNEEIAAILISFERHSEWQSKEVRIRPKSGSMLLYSRKKVRYRRDGYCWKKRKDGKTTREDHMKLKVQGTECIYGCYVHSAILPTFHRRCYWLLQNPDIVLVHYLNVPYPDDNKLSCITPSLALWADKKEWTKEELVSQLKPMFFSEDEPDINNELEISTAETVEAIVSQLMEKQRAARQAALVKQLECGCPDSTCAQDGKQCSHPMRRIRGAEPNNTLQNHKGGAAAREDSNQVSSTTGSGGMLLSTNNHTPRIYTRETRHHHQSTSHQNTTTSTPPLVLSLSQIQSGGGLLILNSSANTSSHSNTHQSLVSPVAVTSFVCNSSNNVRGQHLNSSTSSKKTQQTLVLKQEAMDTNSSCLHANDINKMDITNGNVTELYESLSFRQTNNKHHHASNTEINMSSTHSTPSKRMDTSEDTINQDPNFSCDTVVLLGTEQVNGKSDLNNGFFNETLELSHEDIQRTLSANMPMCSSELEQGRSHSSSNGRNSVIPNKQVVEEIGQDSGVIVSEMNPMDFMDGITRDLTWDKPSANDKIFVLGTDIVVSPTHVVDDDVFVNLDAFDMLSDFPELEVLDGSAASGLLDVTAVDGSSSDKSTEQQSPHMDYREGTANITDYSPEWAYPEGGVKVLVTGPWYSTTSPYTVLFDTFPVPTTLVQSGVLRCYCPAHEAGLATLQVACEGFVISNSVMFEYKVPPNENSSSAAIDTKIETSTSGDSLLRFTLLQRLEAMDDRLQIKQEPDANDGVEDSALFMDPLFEDRLVTYCQTLTTRQWRHSDDLATMQHFAGLRGMTLLHLAASLGYSKLVATMLHWRTDNSSLFLESEVDALSQDEEGFTPLMWACSRGHTSTALMLYRWNNIAINIRNIQSQTPLDIARVNNHLDLAKEIEKMETRRERVSMLNPNLGNCLNSPIAISPASSVVSLTSIASTSKSHDGVFLRPGAVNSASGSISSLSRYSSGNDSNNGFNKGSSQKLVKRPSVDSGINMTSGISSDSLPSLRSTRSSKNGRDIPKLSRFDRSMSLPLNSPLSANDSTYDGSTIDISRTSPRRMEYTLSEGSRPESPFVDVEALSDDDSDEKQQNVVGEQEVRVLTLAEQIIAAMPDRIKNEIEDMQLDNSPKPSDSLNVTDSLSDVFMEPLLDQSSSSFDNTEFNFEFSDHNYRYYDVGTPCSSLSPASSSCLQSPCSFTLDSPSPPPTTADFCEFFQASGNVFEKDFSNLTLSDREQRELYEAAKIIQKAYRSYKGRQHNQLNVNQGQQEQVDKERAAAVLIQNYYRRYKQYAYFKQMTKAAMVIQSGFRSYCEHKRFKKSQEAAVCIQNYYRNYREQGGRGSREGTPASSGLKRTYSQRRQHQAARKIQQFMRQSKNKLQRERAERERQAVQQSSAVRQRSPCPDHSFSGAAGIEQPPPRAATSTTAPLQASGRRHTSNAGSNTANSGGYADRHDMDTEENVPDNQMAVT